MYKQNGIINGSILVMLIAGAVLGGMLVYSARSGQELPLWPSIAVILVNVFAAGKILRDTLNAKKQRRD